MWSMEIEVAVLTKVEKKFIKFNSGFFLNKMIQEVKRRSSFKLFLLKSMDKIKIQKSIKKEDYNKLDGKARFWN